ncbi:PilT/PilU family type 4a pilus ATPase [Granulosicoccus antarcticus]|uniref:Twitching mobility protein n=1 Tax=Granulosicoccus antarcticus IMCC3135 TaxID=1192854 RepID=A0A2Z2NG71_9GAMM|nr:PilT/PilU family type 4a pilus ATPase [Granulosicoccus antarcticus]ASJ70276.1 Twitching mobility protein [Granulosicoccus antarcticus IMCC3135]
MDIYALLKRLVDFDGSDLYLATGAPPSAKFAGELTALSDVPFARGEVEAIANQVMNQDQREEFERELEMNLAIAPEGIGRFRLNIFKQRNEVSLVARNIQTEIPRFDDLGLPDILKDVITAKNGLVLFVGGTGSGKSTSLAALIDHRNSFKGGHIITIEDPVEYVHPHKKCIVNQREVGVDTNSFHAALKNTLRQAPDVILIGEIRDRETMEHAVAFAETGHLAISTLHANNANQALDRIINFFPEERKAQLLHDLGNNIRAIVSQRLVPTVDGKRCAAIEILLGSHTIKQMIMKDQLSDIKEAMLKSENQGMKTFDSALFDLAREGRITEDEALKNADSANNLRLRFKLSGRSGKSNDEDEAEELLLRGQMPSQVAAAKAAAEKEGGADEATAESAQSSEASEPLDVHAAMAQKIASHKAANDGTSGSAGKSSGSNSNLEKAAELFELSLEEEPEPEPSDDDAEEDPAQFGMGRIG